VAEWLYSIWFLIVFIVQLYIQFLWLGNNYITNVNWRTLQFTTTHIKISQPAVLGSFLVSATNGGFYPSSEFQKCIRPQLPVSNSNSSHWLSRNNRRKHSQTNSLTGAYNFWHELQRERHYYVVVPALHPYLLVFSHNHYPVIIQQRMFTRSSCLFSVVP
jgi:hypothetical protein